ncbi:MAG: hypothetical protein ACPHXR_01050 [Flavicella sp.]
MNFLKKIFGLKKESTEITNLKNIEVNLCLDDLFVHNFIRKGGKFLYCTTHQEIISHLISIMEENNWNSLTCLKQDYFAKYTDCLSCEVTSDTNKKGIFLTDCEYLISQNANILFSSNQLKENKLNDLTHDFIILAKTSQIVRNMGESLSGIKTKYKGNIPSNISSIRNYNRSNDEDNFVSSESSNSKNTYLLLFEDL